MMYMYILYNIGKMSIAYQSNFLPMLSLLCLARGRPRLLCLVPVSFFFDSPFVHGWPTSCVTLRRRQRRPKGRQKNPALVRDELPPLRIFLIRSKILVAENFFLNLFLFASLPISLRIFLSYFSFLHHQLKSNLSLSLGVTARISCLRVYKTHCDVAFRTVWKIK